MVKIIEKEYVFDDIREGELFLYGNLLCTKQTHLNHENMIKNTIPVTNCFNGEYNGIPLNLENHEKVKKIKQIIVEV